MDTSFVSNAPISIMLHYPPPRKSWERSGDLNYASRSNSKMGDLIVGILNIAHSHGELSYSPCILM